MTDTWLRLTPYILGKTSHIDKFKIRLRGHLFLTTLNVLGLCVQLVCIEKKVL